MRSRSSTLILACAALLAACQPAQKASAPAQPASSTEAWEHWYQDANGLTKTVTETTDWQLARVGGPRGTTMVVDCNGNDPTAFQVWIEAAGSPGAAYPPTGQPYEIEVYSGGERTLVERSGPGGHTASTALASAMRQGAYMVFRFRGAEPHRYTLKGSARVMDRLNCDPNLL